MQVLRNLPFLKHVPEEVFRAVLRQGTLVKYSRDETIWSPPQPGRHFGSVWDFDGLAGRCLLTLGGACPQATASLESAPDLPCGCLLQAAQALLPPHTPHVPPEVTVHGFLQSMAVCSERRVVETPCSSLQHLAAGQSGSDGMYVIMAGLVKSSFVSPDGRTQVTLKLTASQATWSGTLALHQGCFGTLPHVSRWMAASILCLAAGMIGRRWPPCSGS